jgi:hypothetical protein
VSLLDDGIQIASGSLKREPDVAEPTCEICRRAIAELIADACCGKWCCTGCASTYKYDGTFCSKHLPDVGVEEEPWPVSA